MYFEDKKITTFEKNYDTGIANVSLEDGGNIEVLNWELEVNSGEEIIDASTARNNRGVYVVDKIYDVLKKLDIRTEEISFYVQKLMTKFTGVESAAIISAFGKTQEDAIRLSDWEKQL